MDNSTSQGVKIDKTYFFTVSTFKLIVMSFFTFGLYQFYWFYKNWALIKVRARQTIWSFWQVLFFPLLAYLCFKQIKTTALDSNIASRLPIGILAVGYFISWILWGISFEHDILFFFIAFFVLIGLLIPINNLALRVNKQLVSDFSNNKHFSIWNGIGGILGISFFLWIAQGMLFNKVGNLMQIGTDYANERKLAQALEAYSSALEISEKIDWGRKDKGSEFTTTMLYLSIGNTYNEQGNYLTAERYYQQALHYSETKLGKTSLKTVVVYNFIGTFYELNRDFAQALLYFNKALKVREDILGEDHLDTAKSYSAIGGVYMFQNHYPKAEAAYQQALAIREKTGGKTHLDTAISYSEMGDFYQAQDNYAQALSFHQKTLAIREQILGKRHIDTAATYGKIASLYQEQRNYQQALVFYQKALANYDLVNSYSSHVHAALTHQAIGSLYVAQEDYPNALLFYQKALVIFEQKMNNPYATGQAYESIAGIYQAQNDDSTALLFYQKALVIIESTFGKEHPNIASIYTGMSDIAMKQGDYSQALGYLQKVLAIHEKVFGKLSTQIAMTYGSLGVFYSVQGNHQQALTNNKKAVAIYKTVLGEEHIRTAMAYTGLAGSYSKIGKIEQALLFNGKSLAIHEKVLGKDHLYTALSYEIRGSLYSVQGDAQKAQRYFKMALTIHEKVLGKIHRKTVNSYLLLGVAYQVEGQHAQAYHYAKKGFDLFLKQLNYRFNILNSQQKQNYLQDDRFVDITVFFSIALGYIFDLDDRGKHKEKEQLKQATFDAWLAFKGSVLESENRLIRFAKSSKNPEVQQDYQQLIVLKQSYATLAQEMPEEPKKRFAQKIRLKNKAKKIDQLRNSIRQKDPRFKQAMDSEKVTRKELADQLSPEMLYLDYGKLGDTYIIFMLSDDNLWVSALGEKSKKIDDELATFRKQISMLEKSIIGDAKYINYASQQILGRLHDLVLDIPEKVADKTQLIISPAANLRLLPFEALYDAKAKQYLIEQKSIQYIANGRELMRSLQHSSNQTDQTSNKMQRMVVFSNPDFDHANLTTPHVASNLAAPKKRGALSRSSTQALQFSEVGELPGTAKEAVKIQKVLSNKMQIQLWERAQASEENLLKLKRDQAHVIHIATHGYFNANNSNPMLQSGILLAGALNC